MLATVVVRLSPLKNTEIPLSAGQTTHGLFFDFLSMLSPETASFIHSAPSPKPYSISPLLGEFRVSERGLQVFKEKEYRVRFCSVEKNLSETLLGIEMRDFVRNILKIGTCEFEFLGVAKSEQEDYLAGSTTYEELYDRLYAEKGDAANKVVLRFFTPTTFRTRQRNMPFPLPRLVWQNLVRVWNSYSPLFLGEDVGLIAEEHLAISRYDLETKVIEFNGYKQVGCIGYCEYQFSRKSSTHVKKILHMLAEFSFYSGIGHKRTMGMGQARRVEKSPA